MYKRNSGFDWKEICRNLSRTHPSGETESLDKFLFYSNQILAKAGDLVVCCFTKLGWDQTDSFAVRPYREPPIFDRGDNGERFWLSGLRFDSDDRLVSIEHPHSRWGDHLGDCYYRFVDADWPQNIAYLQVCQQPGVEPAYYDRGHVIQGLPNGLRISPNGKRIALFSELPPAMGGLWILSQDPKEFTQKVTLHVDMEDYENFYADTEIPTELNYSVTRLLSGSVEDVLFADENTLLGIHSQNDGSYVFKVDISEGNGVERIFEYGQRHEDYPYLIAGDSTQFYVGFRNKRYGRFTSSEITRDVFLSNVERIVEQ